VLGTNEDEAAARAAFQRLKSTYPAVLDGIEPQIEVVAGQGNTSWARLSVRPLASQEEARDLCRRLSEAGHTGCWVKPQVTDTNRAFVAILATRDEGTAARDAFITLKSRFPAALEQAEPVIETVRMQNGSTWYRATASPAGSRDEARALCRRLRTLGHFGCWVKPQS
jgi:hypothetical protein